MTLNEQLDFVNNCTKKEFISFAKEINVIRTLKEPNYLAIKDEILKLLPKFNLTVNDILPDPRILIGDSRAIQANK